MAYQALYRKYRPNSFTDFIDQDSVKRILVNSIKNNKISHAYLFSGPRGIGKTSMAKIFAKAINCDNFSKNDDVCNSCPSCLEADNGTVDIVEIDAASNNGVDQIRDLRNKISIVPSNLKYKVYIIDEVHMLTNSAFNALLKTLEEPPSYVVFILATTEFYEVPETIVSRCQCFNFNRISMKSLEERLKFISKEEKIKITDDAIKEIAEFSNGGLRDAISMLDKVRSFVDDKITVDVFKSLNGMVSHQDINDFYESIINKDVSKILNLITKIDEAGYDFKNFIERVMLLVRDKIVSFYIDKEQLSGTLEENINIVEVLNDILNRLKEAINPIVIVQIYILKLIGNQESTTVVEKVSKEEEIIAREIISEPKVNESVNKEQKTEEKPIKQEEITQQGPKFIVDEKIKNIRINNAMATANKKYKTDLSKIWNNLSDYFMDENFGKFAQLLSDTTPMVVGDNYLIITSLSEGLIDNIYQNLSQVENFISKIYNPMKIVVITDLEFESVKNKYIEDKNNNIVYQLQEEYGKLVIDNNNLINQAIELFGSDLVDIE